METWKSHNVGIDNNIFREKYLLGSFHMFPDIDMNIETINDIHNSIKKFLIV